MNPPTSYRQEFFCPSGLKCRGECPTERPRKQGVSERVPREVSLGPLTAPMLWSVHKGFVESVRDASVTLRRHSRPRKQGCPRECHARCLCGALCSGVSEKKGSSRLCDTQETLSLDSTERERDPGDTSRDNPRTPSFTARPSTETEKHTPEKHKNWPKTGETFDQKFRILALFWHYFKVIEDEWSVEGRRVLNAHPQFWGTLRGTWGPTGPGKTPSCSLSAGRWARNPRALRDHL